MRTVLVCGALLLGACKHTYSPRQEGTDWSAERMRRDASRQGTWGADQKDPNAEHVAAFCDALLELTPRPASVACLPLVNYELRSTRSRVSELGVALADDVARVLREKGFGGATLGTSDVKLRLSQVNVARGDLTTMESVAAQSPRLGTDLVVFGTIKRRDRVGTLERDVLTCELAAYEVAGRRIATSKRWEVPSDDVAYRQVWDMAQEESSWSPDSKWGIAADAPTLSAELKRVAADLATALARDAGNAVQGTVYVAPLDTAGFVRSLSRLRAAQAAYAVERARRAGAAQAAGAAIDAGPIVLNGTEFPSLQAAESYLITLSESLAATDAARFGESFSALLADEVVARVRPGGGSVLDPGFTAQSDVLLVEGEIASGGLARSAAAREALEGAGVGLVVAPRLEKLGDDFQVRAQVIDLAGGRVAATATAPIPRGLHAELKRALGSEDLQPVGELERATGSWQKVYEGARSGVLHVAGPEGRGTGFVVRKDGLIVTNDHVVRGVGAPIVVVPEGGPELVARVVAQDPYWDLALLQADGLPARTHVFAFADGVAVGTEVAVLGHPKDSSGWVFTPGHVSSTTERVPVGDGRERASLMYTCPTRQGSSGSPVLLSDGRVAAVHSAGRVGQSLSGSADLTELTGFALGIPAGEARAFVERAPRP